MKGRQPGKLEHAAEHILGHEGPEVADVGRAIDGRSAAIKAEGPAVERLERAEIAGAGVEKADHTGA